MAKISFKNYEEYGLKLQALGRHFFQDEPLHKAVRAGADVLADEVRKEINNLPEEGFHKLRGHDDKMFIGPPQVFRAVPHTHKKALQEGFGITDIKTDGHGFVHAKLGFEGYADEVTKSKTYPNGLPIPLIARAIESGSSNRAKIPFVRPAVHRKRKEAIQAMEDKLREEIEGVMIEGGKLTVD